MKPDNKDRRDGATRPETSSHLSVIILSVIEVSKSEIHTHIGLGRGGATNIPATIHDLPTALRIICQNIPR